MNNRQVKTRTQRRVEKRQALTVLGLALVALLASFVFGVMVGRRGGSAEEEVAVVRVETPPAPTPAVVPPPAPPAPEPAPAPEAMPVEEVKDPLTFYDRLPNGEAPLGSGVNLPPAAEKPAMQQPAMPAEPKAQPLPAPATTAVQAASPAPAPPEPAAALVTKPGGGYGVQVGAFQSATDAGKLVSQLGKKGYPAVVVEADLGAKGRWYRVRVGPFDKTGAEKAAARLSQDQYKGFVTRM